MAMPLRQKGYEERGHSKVSVLLPMTMRLELVYRAGLQNKTFTDKVRELLQRALDAERAE